MPTSIRADQSLKLDALQRYARENEGFLKGRIGKGGVLEVYASKRGTGSWENLIAPHRPWERQQLAAIALYEAVANSYNHDVADKVMNCLRKDLQNPDRYLTADLIDRAKVIAEAAKGAANDEDDDGDVVKDRPYPDHPTAGGAKKASAQKRKLADADLRPPEPSVLADPSAIDLTVVDPDPPETPPHQQRRQSMSDLPPLNTNDLAKQLHNISTVAKKAVAARKERPPRRRRSGSLEQPRQQNRNIKRLQGQLFLNTVTFKDLMEAARDPNVPDRLGDAKGFQVGSHAGPTRAGAEKAILDAFADYPESLSSLSDAVKKKIAVDALKSYLALPPYPPTHEIKFR